MASPETQRWQNGLVAGAAVMALGGGLLWLLQRKQGPHRAAPAACKGRRLRKAKATAVEKLLEEGNWSALGRLSSHSDGSRALLHPSIAEIVAATAEQTSFLPAVQILANLCIADVSRKAVLECDLSNVVVAATSERLLRSPSRLDAVLQLLLNLSSAEEGVHWMLQRGLDVRIFALYEDLQLKKEAVSEAKLQIAKIVVNLSSSASYQPEVEGEGEGLLALTQCLSALLKRQDNAVLLRAVKAAKMFRSRGGALKTAWEEELREICAAREHCIEDEVAEDAKAALAG